MSIYHEETYGQSISNSYDHLYGDFVPSAAQIGVLAEFTGGGLAIEIGSGTGRVTVPLARAGIRVIGVDAAPSMASVLREKTRGLPVEAVCADAADYRAPEQAALVFAVFNTFFLLASESVQERFIGCAAEMLQPGGRLVLETFVPRPGRLPDGPNPGVLPEQSDVVVKRWVPDGVVLFAARNVPEERRFEYHEIVLRSGEPVQLHPGRMRYMWPEDIDELAARNGFTLEDRWANWERSRYRHDSPKHISIYVR